MAYHLTSRLQWREPLFQDREAEVVGRIADAVAGSGVQLLAYAVMPSHLHLVVVQGVAPLARLMQPLLRQTALAIHRELGREGHVFERRYRHTACADPEYLRNTIAYVHMNPVRAGLCEKPEDYSWTSHSAYTGEARQEESGLDQQLSVEAALRLFAPDSASGSDVSRRNYMAFMRWRLEMDIALAADPEAGVGDVGFSPDASGGDRFWSSGSALRAVAPHPVVTPDLRAIALEVLRSHPLLTLECLRGGGRSRALVRVRRTVIARAVQAGYRTAQIARFLRISPSAVSIVAAPLRALTGRRRLLAGTFVECGARSDA